MKSDRPAPVAIVGGGFSGTILAAQLARRGIASVLIDGSGRAGHGVAYSTTEPTHLLNVRAEGMSAWAGEPDDFARRFEAEGGEARGFAPRRLFGAYLKDILADACAGGLLRIEESEAVAASRSGGAWRIALADKRDLAARALVLAVGNQEPDALRAFADAGDRYINNPWASGARAAVEQLAQSDGSALLIGTGLTMVDLVLSLDAAGHRGPILALSRRGQIPRSHADFDASPVDWDTLPAGNLGALWRWLRRKSAEVGWRAAVDSLRPHSHALWQSLDAGQQRRFLRHVRPWWDVHRHRIAPEVARTIVRAIGEGRLEIVAGRIVAARAADDALEVDIRRRRAAEAQPMRFDYAFNCTGPLHSIGHTRDPLLRSLLDGGGARPDPLGIGLDVDERSRVAGGERIWALGSLTKARYWEIIAVPDIREQAAAVADDIARELQQ
jgi:uncharacterized NAD(P)/FAD-binding protein YdhS